jgi:hypothetical protein
LRKAIIRLLLVGGMVIGLAAPAQAATCAVYDPDLEYVVCDTVVMPVLRVVCGTKFGHCG